MAILIRVREWDRMRLNSGRAEGLQINANAKLSPLR
jgi:hypothetical protein